MRLLMQLRSFWRPKPDETWKNIGSPSYRKAVMSLGPGCRAIRRKSWEEGRCVYIPDPSIHIYQDYHDGRPPSDLRLWPPRCRMVHRTKSARWGKEYWQAPEEDINADDWEVRWFGNWGALGE